MHEHYGQDKNPNTAKLHQLEEHFRRNSTGGKKAHKTIVSLRQDVKFAAQNFEMDAMREELATLETDQQLWSWVHQKITVNDNKFSASPNYAQTVNMVFERLAPNPPLALALFHLVSTISPQSYVAGVTAPLYYNLCKLKWTLYFDVQGVEETVNTMLSSGITIDWPIRTLVTTIRLCLDADLNKAYAPHDQAETDLRCRFSRSDRKALSRLEHLIAEQPTNFLSRSSEDYQPPRFRTSSPDRPHRPFSHSQYSDSISRPKAIEEFTGPLWTERVPLDGFIEEMEADGPPRGYPRAGVRNRAFSRAFSTDACSRFAATSKRALSISASGRAPSAEVKPDGTKEEEEKRNEGDWGFERPSWAGTQPRRNKWLDLDKERAQAKEDRRAKSAAEDVAQDPPQAQSSSERHSQPATQPETSLFGRNLSSEEKAKEDEIWAAYAPQRDAEEEEIWNKFGKEGENPNAKFREPLWPEAIKALKQGRPMPNFTDAPSGTPMGRIYKQARKNLTRKEKARFDTPHPMLAWKEPFDKAALKKKLSKSGRAPVFRKASKSIWDN